LRAPVRDAEADNELLEVKGLRLHRHAKLMAAPGRRFSKPYFRYSFQKPSLHLRATVTSPTFDHYVSVSNGGIWFLGDLNIRVICVKISEAALSL
jgi:hypothetical protein